VLACEPEWAALALALGGPDVEVFSAVPAGRDPHRVEARPSLVAQARRAHLLVCTGADLEVGWLPLLLSRSGNPRIQTGAPGHFLAAAHVSLLQPPERLDRSLGDIHPAGNPHLALDPRRMRAVAAALRDRLAALEPAAAPRFRANFTRLENSLAALERELQPERAALAGAAVAVHHDSWAYLLDWLGMRLTATIEPLPGVAPSGGHLAELAARLRDQRIDLVIRADHEDPRPAAWVGARVGRAPLALPMAPPDWQAPDALPRWYRDLVDRLASQLPEAAALGPPPAAPGATPEG
jgi:zinc/manganese transport system substrate-binding protein